MKNRYLILYVLILLFTCSCRRYHTQQQAQNDITSGHKEKEVLLQINEKLVEKDAEEIRAYAEKKGWKMRTTQSGLWYMIYQHGSGEKAAKGKDVELNYTLSLLDSVVCYTSEKSGPKKFKIGQGGPEGPVEAGLEEGVLLMRTGDKARLIMPPHLAHGLTGDENCIPRRATIVYDIELLNVK
ncbi:MAG: FKBP-type peptidyl-prolyl cis-trans isomerase [Bacteroidales bacterium]|jgi:FKBP-type peptidyl-prolyl cis-trans isomerase|nr:FKBP-type peptidyl-prolyl cis-trans isomerase [Bacteroidales bacterium]